MGQRAILLVVVVVLLSFLSCFVPLIRSEESQSTTSTTTTTTATTPIETKTTTKATNAQPNQTTTPTTTMADVAEVKKVIQERLVPSVAENRFAINKPQTQTYGEFAPDSIEAKVADSTTQFGLNFIKSLEAKPDENLLLSPISMQNLLNMILLGADDSSRTQLDLIKALNYDSTELISSESNSNSSSSSSADEMKLRPHKAMRNLLDNITRATHLVLNPNNNNNNATELLNSNLDEPKLVGHLQTSLRDNGTALNGQVNFTLANLILTRADYPVSEQWEKQLDAYYNAKVESFVLDKDQKKNSNQSKPIEPLHCRINNWVKKMTQNQIEQLVEAADVQGDDLIMLLLNAAHFKGRWLYTFNPKATSERLFYNGGLESGATEVKFMRQKANFGYAEFGQQAQQAQQQDQGEGLSMLSAAEDAETLLTEDAGKQQQQYQPNSGGNQQQPATGLEQPAIELSKEETKRFELTSKLNCSALMMPFSLNDGQELSMVILLPTKRDGLKELIGALNWQNLNEIYRSLNEQQVQVELPKFTFENSHDAQRALEKLGLASLFNEANISAMLKSKLQGAKLRVDKIIHKAKIQVDELGAEAAAASMGSIVLRNFNRQPTPVFIADRPFLFIIRHNRSNMPLFMGTLNSFCG